MSPRRILFICPVGERGGAETVLLDIATGLDRTRFTPYIVCLKPGPFVEELRSFGITTYVFPSHKLREMHRVLWAIREIDRIVKREKIDILHPSGGSMLLYTTLAQKARSIPCIWHVHDPLKGRGLFERFCVTIQRRLRVDSAIYSSPGTAESQLSTYRNIKKHSIIFPSVDVDTLNQDANPERAREKFGIPPQAQIVSMFARLQRGKGQIELVKAARQVCDILPETRFLLCGGTLFGKDPEYKEEIEAAIRENGLDKIAFLTGFVSEELKKDILAASSLIAHPPYNEPFGIAVLEGMALAKPVVATDCSGPKMTILPNKTGLLVPKGDTNALAQAILSLLRDPNGATRMGAEGLHRVQANYSHSAMVTQIESVYNTVIHGVETGDS